MLHGTRVHQLVGPPASPTAPDCLRENHDHLLFVSYPCGFAKLQNRKMDEWPEQLESGSLVQCFNIVRLGRPFLFFPEDSRSVKDLL